MRKVLLSVLLALCLAVPAQAGNLTVSAAASLTDAFNAIKADFDKQNTGVNLTMALAFVAKLSYSPGQCGSCSEKCPESRTRSPSFSGS